MSHHRTARALTTLAFLAAAPLAAQAPTTITFAANACTGSSFNFYNSPFDLQGFRLYNALPLAPHTEAFATPCSGNASYAGATTLFANRNGSPTVLHDLSDAPFSISSIELAQFLSGTQPAQVVTFTGTLVGGATVMQSFTIPTGSGSPTLATFTFLPTFANLRTLQFSAQGPQSYQFYQFTNLRLNQVAVTTTPEPGTWALLGTGLMALGGVARRKRTRV